MEPVMPVREEEAARPFVRHNSTSTVKVQHTMSHPNHNATIEVIANVLHEIITRSDSRDSEKRPFGKQFDLRCFNDPMFSTPALVCSDSDTEGEEEYDEDKDGDGDEEDEAVEEQKITENVLRELDLLSLGGSPPKIHSGKGQAAASSIPGAPVSTLATPRELPSFNRRGKCRTAAAVLPLPPVVKPTAATIREYLKNMFVTAQCSEECNIICLIYLQRLLEYCGDDKALDAYNWKAATMTALLLASKVWDDLSMVNEDFSIFMPYTLDQINSWEVQFLACLKFNVRVGASEYARMYFELRNLAQRAGYELLPEREVDMEHAKRLEVLTSTMEQRTKQLFCYQPGSPNAAPQEAGQQPASAVPAAMVAEMGLRRISSDAGRRQPSWRYVID